MAGGRRLLCDRCGSERRHLRHVCQRELAEALGDHVAHTLHSAASGAAQNARAAARNAGRRRDESVRARAGAVRVWGAVCARRQVWASSPKATSSAVRFRLHSCMLRVACRPSHVARRMSPVACRPSHVARRPSPVAWCLSPGVCCVCDLFRRLHVRRQHPEDVPHEGLQRMRRRRHLAAGAGTPSAD